jgi:hypothetical protein
LQRVRNRESAHQSGAQLRDLLFELLDRLLVRLDRLDGHLELLRFDTEVLLEVHQLLLKLRRAGLVLSDLQTPSQNNRPKAKSKVFFMTAKRLGVSFVKHPHAFVRAERALGLTCCHHVRRRIDYLLFLLFGR